MIVLPKSDQLESSGFPKQSSLEGGVLNGPNEGRPQVDKGSISVARDNFVEKKLILTQQPTASANSEIVTPEIRENISSQKTIPGNVRLEKIYYNDNNNQPFNPFKGTEEMVGILNSNK